MTAQATYRMLKKYEETGSPQLFLSSLAQTPPENYHDQDTVVVDIIRNEYRAAIPLPRGASDPRRVEQTKYVSKEVSPPTYDTAGEITIANATARQSGMSPFDPAAPRFKNLVKEIFGVVRQLDDITRRGVEVQMSQIFTTGKLDLKDATGTTVFDYDFQPKSTHFPSLGTAWAADGTTGDPIADFNALGDIILRDGKAPITQVIMGAGAGVRFVQNAKVRDLLDKRRLDAGQIDRPQSRGGASYLGSIVAGTQELEIWVYKGFYYNEQSQTNVPFLADNKVILRAGDANRIDLTFGSIPTLVEPDPRVAHLMPARMSDPKTGFDVSTNIWLAPNNKSLSVSVGTRALAYPTAIDTYGCLTVF
jgi:hypothetical protein